MHRLLLTLPTQLESTRLRLRCYQAGDGPWYYTMSARNRTHLARYEAGNPALGIRSEEDAEVVIREFASYWVARTAFFFGAFRRDTGEFVAQIYVGPRDWSLPQFDLGYFVDVDHEGQGYVTEAAQVALHFAFHHLQAHRVALECDDTNRRSSSVAERCGFIREGHVREHKQNSDGTISGTLHYGLLRRDFTG